MSISTVELYMMMVGVLSIFVSVLLAICNSRILNKPKVWIARIGIALALVSPLTALPMGFSALALALGTSMPAFNTFALSYFGFRVIIVCGIYSLLVVFIHSNMIKHIRNQKRPSNLSSDK